MKSINCSRFGGISTMGDPAATDRPDSGERKGAELGPVLETIENALRADQAKMIEAE